MSSFHRGSTHRAVFQLCGCCATVQRHPYEKPR